MQQKFCCNNRRTDNLVVKMQQKFCCTKRTDNSPCYSSQIAAKLSTCTQGTRFGAIFLKGDRQRTGNHRQNHLHHANAFSAIFSEWRSPSLLTVPKIPPLPLLPPLPPQSQPQTAASIFWQCHGHRWRPARHSHHHSHRHGHCASLSILAITTTTAPCSAFCHRLRPTAAAKPRYRGTRSQDSQRSVTSRVTDVTL